MIVKEVNPSERCSLCHQDLRYALMVYATRTAKIVHKACLERIIGGVSQSPHLAIEKEREIKKFDTKGVQRILYVMVGAITLCAFGVLDSLARALIIVNTAAPLGYLLAKGCDRYASWRAVHKIRFAQ